MLGSSNNPPLDLRDALALLEQSIKDFQAERKKLIRLKKSSKSNTKAKVDLFTSIIEAIEDSLQQLSSSIYVLDIKESLISLFQEERNRVLQSESDTELGLFDSTLQAVDEGLEQLESRSDELRKQLQNTIRANHEKVLEREKKKWWERRKKIIEGES